MNKKGVVYKITNNINGMCYIGGATIELVDRWGVHKTSARQGKKTKLHVDMALFGIENFSIEELERCPDKKKLAEREDYYIRYNNSLWPNGYNSYLRTPRYFDFNGCPKIITQIKEWLSDNEKPLKYISDKTGISYTKIMGIFNFRTIGLRQEDLVKINEALGTEFEA